MQLLYATLYSYAKQNLSSLPNIYKWKFDTAIVLNSFNLIVNGQSWHEKTRALKRCIANEWNSSPTQRIALADYAVRVWGGVRSNAAETIQGYVQILSQGQVPPTHKGIASWSKVAAFSNPDFHAIFDARVSFSLNAIQMLQGGIERWWFPHLAGRNKLLNATWPLLKSKATQQNWSRIESTKVYSTYIELLKAVAKQLNVEIDDIEMLLFSKAEELAREVEIMENGQ